MKSTDTATPAEKTTGTHEATPAQINHARNTLSALLTRSLFGADILLPQGEADWTLVYDEAVTQTVSAVAFDGIRKSDNVPEEIFSRWRSVAFSTAMRQNAFYSAVAKLHTLLSGADIDYAVFKGIANARYYPKPELRIQGDVDFLVNPSDFESADEILKGAGFKPLSSGNDIHLRYSFGGCVFEMHRAIGGIPSAENGEKAQKMMLDGLKNAEEVTIGVCRYRALHVDLEAVITLIHMHEHLLETSTTLRHLCDFALVSSHASDGFDEIAKELGICKAKSIYTSAASKIFGNCFGSSEKQADFDESDVQTLLGYFWEGGHFGRSYENYRGGTLVSSAVESGGSFAGSVKDYVQRSYPLSKRFPVLLPLFFILCCLKYLFLILSGKRRAFNPAQVAADFERKKSVFEKIDLFETNNNSDL